MDGKIADRKGYEYMRKLSGSTDPPDPNQVCFVNSSSLSFISMYHDKLESKHNILLSILSNVEVEVEDYEQNIYLLLFLLVCSVLWNNILRYTN